jgi:hypothetical protein
MSHQMPHDGSRAAGHRSTTRRTRLNATTLLAVVLPVLCAGALLLVRPDPAPTDETHPPTRTALTSATLVCPAGLPDSSPVSVGSAARGAGGQVQIGLGADRSPADVVPGQVTTVDAGSGPLAVTGRDETAPGLVAARLDEAGAAAAGCTPPLPAQWFTGVGAGAGHTSTLELVNPDAGTAIADVTVYGRAGVVDVPRLRGVSVPGGSSVELDLNDVVPRRDDLALEVVASRGRIGASVLDRYDRVGPQKLTQDYLPAQAAPSESNLLMGVAPGSGQRTLVLANGGDDEVRATVKLVTDDSVFTPEGLDEVRVPPQGVERVSLSDVLDAAGDKEDTTGILVTSTGPVTATFRSLVDGDLSHAVSGVPLDGPATVLVPTGEKRLVLAGSTRAGAVTVVARSADGDQLARTTAELTPGRGATVRLAAKASLLTVTPARTAVTGSVLLTENGAAVVPLTQPLTSGLVPHVRPGLP